MHVRIPNWMYRFYIDRFWKQHESSMECSIGKSSDTMIWWKKIAQKEKKKLECTVGIELKSLLIRVNSSSWFVSFLFFTCMCIFIVYFVRKLLCKCHEIYAFRSFFVLSTGKKKKWLFLYQSKWTNWRPNLETLSNITTHCWIG